MTDERTLYITTWRKPAPDVLDHDYFVSSNLREVEEVVANLRKQGVWQYYTYPLGEKLPDHSCEH